MFEERHTRTTNGTRTFFSSSSKNAVKYISTRASLNKRSRVSLETFRGASHAGSLLIGSGSFAPAVDTRRREDYLPAFVVSRHLSATFRVLRPTCSASPLHPREAPPPTPNRAVAPPRSPTAGRKLSLALSHHPDQECTPRSPPPGKPASGNAPGRLARSQTTARAHNHGAHNVRHRFRRGGCFRVEVPPTGRHGLRRRKYAQSTPKVRRARGGRVEVSFCFLAALSNPSRVLSLP
jgi:hypothetical protein